MGSIPERGRGFASGDGGGAGLRRPHVEDPEPALELLCEGHTQTQRSPALRATKMDVSSLLREGRYIN